MCCLIFLACVIHTISRVTFDFACPPGYRGVKLSVLWYDNIFKVVKADADTPLDTCTSPGVCWYHPIKESPVPRNLPLSQFVVLIHISIGQEYESWKLLSYGLCWLYCRRARDTQAHHVTPQLLFPDDTGPSQQCYVANAAFRCTKRRAGTSTDNIDDKCNYACEMTVDSSYGSRRNCNEPLTNPSPKPRPVPDSRVRYKVVGYPGNMNTFKQPRAPRSDTDASREVHGFTACRYSRCRSRDDGDVIDLTGTLLNAK